MARAAAVGSKGSKFIILASVCIVVGGLYFAREVLIPIALAVLLTFLLTPPVRRLERWKLPRVAATLIVVIIGLAALVSIGYVVFNQFVSVVEQLPNYRGQLHEKWDRLKSHGGVLKKAEQELHNIGSTSQPASQPAESPVEQLKGSAAALKGENGPSGNPANAVPVRVIQPPQTTAQSAVTTVTGYAEKFLGPLATAFLVVVLVIFMLLTREDLRDRMIRLVGHGHLNLTTQATDDAAGRISRYLGALAIVNGAYGACVAGGLWLIGHLFGHGTGFPNVLVWGLLVGLFRFVPYVGIWIGAAVPLALSFALFPGNGAFFATVGLFVTLEVMVSQFIEPYWYGASTGMSALAVLVAAVFWTWLWGPIGLLLSTPLTVCLVVLGKYVPQLQFLDILLGDEPVLPPHTRLYQRLIASDEEEAVELAHELLKERSLEKVYDEVLLPALLMAERDYQHERLAPERLEFVEQSIRDMVEELGEDARAKRLRNAAADVELAAKDQPPENDAGKPRPSLPKECNINVLCLPAKGEADEIVAQMLGQLLELRGYCVLFASADQLASEMVEMAEQKRARIVCVSALPPAAVAHARYLCKRLHARFPDVNMIVGVWHARGDLDRIKQRIACEDTVHVVTMLARAQEQIDQLAQAPAVRDTTS